MSPRRHKGDGGLIQRHDHPSCPPLEVVGHDEDGKPIRERPKHTCHGRWVGTFDVTIDEVHRRKYVYAKTQKAARIKLETAKREYEKGTLVISSMTTEAWLMYWLDNVAEIKPQTRRGYRTKINTYLVPRLGARRLTDLRPEHIRALHKWMREQGLAEATLRQTHAILAKALRDAVNDGKLASSPTDRVKPPKTETQRRESLTVDQARTVLRTAGDDARWWLALFYGMRQGECLGLRWGDVDFVRHTITVTQTLQKAEDGSLFFGAPKSKASRRVLPMLGQIEVRLRLLHERSAAIRPSGQLPGDALVFGRADGSPRRPRDDWQVWRDLLDRATTPPLAPIPLVALHAARNTAASLMEAGGVPDRLVAQILGHSQVQITHGYQDAELSRMSSALGPVGDLLALDAPEA